MNTSLSTNQIVVQFRKQLIEMSYNAKAAHLGSALSCADLIAVLFHNILRLDSKNIGSRDRDRFILSKGHAASALYIALASKGIICETDLKQYGCADTHMGEHPSPVFPGVEAATGSLGHGLPIGCGIALAARIQKLNYRVYVLMSDGECNEGSVWEAAMFASRHRLHNLIAMVDYNKWQATGRSQEVLQIEPLVEKWESFGWHTIEVDGHDHDQIYKALKKTEPATKPNMIIAHTVKGKGVSFMEDDNNWHYRVPSKNEVNAAIIELEQ